MHTDEMNFWLMISGLGGLSWKIRWIVVL